MLYDEVYVKISGNEENYIDLKLRVMDALILSIGMKFEYIKVFFFF